MSKFKSILFDCDGVILNSNKLKSDAFYETVASYGENSASQFLSYHKNNGGISRFKKFEYFLKHIVYESDIEAKLSELLRNYADLISSALLSCEVCSGLDRLRAITPNCKWFVVSGGNEEEINKIFKMRGIAGYFDGGIFGNPRSKDEIFWELTDSGCLEYPGIYFGDSRYDHEVSVSYGLEFIFISGWSEFSNWEDYCHSQSILWVENVEQIAGALRL